MDRLSRVIGSPDAADLPPVFPSQGDAFPPLSCPWPRPVPSYVQSSPEQSSHPSDMARKPYRAPREESDEPSHDVSPRAQASLAARYRGALHVAKDKDGVTGLAVATEARNAPRNIGHGSLAPMRVRDLPKTAIARAANRGLGIFHGVLVARPNAPQSVWRECFKPECPCHTVGPREASRVTGESHLDVSMAQSVVAKNARVVQRTRERQVADSLRRPRKRTATGLPVRPQNESERMAAIRYALTARDMELRQE